MGRTDLLAPRSLEQGVERQGRLCGPVPQAQRLEGGDRILGGQREGCLEHGRPALEPVGVDFLELLDVEEVVADLDVVPRRREQVSSSLSWTPVGVRARKSSSATGKRSPKTRHSHRGITVGTGTPSRWTRANDRHHSSTETESTTTTRIASRMSTGHTNLSHVP
jgi:hypothetical protein